MTTKKLLLAIIALSLLCYFMANQSLSAQVPQPTSGITVAPAFSTAQVGSLQTETVVSVGVRNNFSVPISLNAAIGGIDVRNNSLLPADAPDPKLIALTTVTPANFSLQPNESINVQVLIKDSPELSPGGQFISLIVKQTSEKSSQLSLEPAVSVGIYVIKEDGAIRKIEIQQTEIMRSIFSLPESVDITLKNSGNVAIVPRGLAGIAKTGSSFNISQGAINTGSAPLYPDQTIKLRVPLDTFKNTLAPGKYAFQIDYRYEGQDIPNSTVNYFWYLPKVYLWLIILLPLLVIGGVKLFRKLQRKRATTKPAIRKPTFVVRRQPDQTIAPVEPIKADKRPVPKTKSKKAPKKTKISLKNTSPERTNVKVRTKVK